MGGEEKVRVQTGSVKLKFHQYAGSRCCFINQKTLNGSKLSKLIWPKKKKKVSQVEKGKWIEPSENGQQREWKPVACSEQKGLELRIEESGKWEAVMDRATSSNKDVDSKGWERVAGRGTRRGNWLCNQRRSVGWKCTGRIDDRELEFKQLAVIPLDAGAKEGVTNGERGLELQETVLAVEGANTKNGLVDRKAAACHSKYSKN